MSRLYFCVKEEILAEKTTVHEAIWKLIQSFQETNQTIAESFVASQERNRNLAQSFFLDGMAVLRANQEAAEKLLTAQERTRELAQRFFSDGMEILKTNQEAAKSLVSAQEGNVKYAQRFFTDGTQILEGQAEGVQTLMQELERQMKKQQEALQTLAHATVESYVDFLRSPLTYYQQTLEAAEALTRQGLEQFQKAALQMQNVLQPPNKQP